MANKRITERMKLPEILITMSEENHGALMCMLEMLKTYPMTFLEDIRYFDSMGICGSKIYKLWNDCCGRNMSKFKETIHKLRSGAVSKEEIHENLNRDHAVPFF